MDRRTALILRDLNERFYRENSLSFSQTRQSPWPGWVRVLDDVGRPQTVFDLASGNLRFQKYLDERFDGFPIKHFCVDSCDSLVDPACDVSYQHLDIVGCAIEGSDLSERLLAPHCDLCTTFGFMHHVPGADARKNVVRALLEKTVSGGHVALSFWRFANDAKRRQKAAATTEEALRTLDVDLDENDFLLGWKDVSGAYRYCHSFTDEEIDALLDGLKSKATLVDCFESDGKTGDMNAYRVLKIEY